MRSMQHIALFIDNSVDKDLLLSRFDREEFLLQFDLNKLSKTVLYSSVTVDKMLDEELKHDRFLIRSENNTALQHMSSGQQRKALLKYLIAQKPDLMILDDVYSNVDKESQAVILKTLTQLSDSVSFIQIFSRKRDLLPFVENVYVLNSDFSIDKEIISQSFLSTQIGSPLKNTRSILPIGYNNHDLKFDLLIELNSVSVKYDERQILTDVNWEICVGQFWQLVGPNGSGKSTLVSMITGDNPKAYGQNMKLFGYQKGSGESIWDIKQHIGYFTPAMIRNFERDDSVENMIISGFNDSIGLYAQPTDLQKKIASKWLDMLGDSFKNKSFRHLSVGQQRMVMVARALVKHPPLLILDEPTIELDEHNSRLFIEMVNAIAAESKIAIIYVSHRDEENLQPSHIFELVVTENGYTGLIRK